MRQNETREQRSIRELHDQKKSVQKKYFDRRYHAKAKVINPGDQVLLKQRKTTTKPPYNPNPFIVTGVVWMAIGSPCRMERQHVYGTRTS